METRRPVHFALQGVIRDQWYLVSVYPCEVGITVYWLDYNAQKNSEGQLEQLLSENHRHKALLDAIFQADPSGLAVVAGPELRLAFCNPAYRFFTPNPSLDPLGQPYTQVWHGHEWLAYYTDLEQALRTGKPALADGVEHCFPDGSTKYFSIQIRRVQWEAEPAALIILWDTTEQAQARLHLTGMSKDLEAARDAFREPQRRKDT